MNKEELILKATSLYVGFDADNYDEKELTYMKAEINNAKSMLYLNMNSFESKAECFLHINNLNSLSDIIDFELNRKYKLLIKIREKAILMLGKDGWADFLAQCKDEL